MTGKTEPVAYVCFLGHRLQRPGFAMFASPAEHARFLRSLSGRRNHALPTVSALVALCESALPSREPVAVETYQGGGLKVVPEGVEQLMTLVGLLLHDFAVGTGRTRIPIGLGRDGEALFFPVAPPSAVLGAPKGAAPEAVR
jgi:hypothetical protein